MGKYKYIFFDMDGTLGDTQEGIFNCTKYAFEKLGVSIDTSYESLSRVIGPPLVFAYQQYFGLSEEDAVKATEYYRERYSVKGVYEMNLYDGVEQMLKKLKSAGFTLALVSAKPEEYVEKIVKHKGIDKYFSFNSSASKKDTDTSKKRLITRAIEHFNISDLSEVVMVGDRIYDLDGAKDAFVDGVGVLYGYGSREELEACDNVFIASTPQELCDFLLNFKGEVNET